MDTTYIHPSPFRLPPPQSLVKSDAEPLPADEAKAAVSPAPPTGPEKQRQRQRQHKSTNKKSQHQHMSQQQALVVEEGQEREGEGEGVPLPSTRSSGGVSALGAVLLAGATSLVSLALGVWIGRTTAARDGYTALRV